MKYLVLICGLALISCSDNSEPTNPEAKETSEVNPTAQRSYQLTDTIKTASIEGPGEITDGPVTIHYESGVIKAKGVLKNGKKNSLWQSFYEDGTMWSSTYFVDGLQHGHTVSYYPDGKVQYQGEYRNGKRVGTWKIYDKEGNLVEEQTY